MVKVYKPVHIRFLTKNVKGRTQKDLVALFNKRFRMKKTASAIKTLCLRYGLKNDGYGQNQPHLEERKYHEKHLNYLRKIVPGKPFKTALIMFNKKFGFDIGIKAFGTLCKRYDIANGLCTTFQKGHVPFYKGKKGQYAPGCEVSWFKKGHMPENTMPLGSERLSKDGYIEVKYSNDGGPPNKRWKGKHRIIWERENGPISKGCAIIFLDGNKRNFKLNNLRMVSRGELAVLNHTHMLDADEEVVEANIEIAKIKVLISDKKRASLINTKKKELTIVDNNGKRIVVVQDRKTKRFIPVRKTKSGFIRLWVKRLKSRKTADDARKDLIAYALERGWYRE
jgi:hypothetical protein